MPCHAMPCHSIMLFNMHIISNHVTHQIKLSEGLPRVDRGATNAPARQQTAQPTTPPELLSGLDHRQSNCQSKLNRLITVAISCKLELRGFAGPKYQGPNNTRDSWGCRLHVKSIQQFCTELQSFTCASIRMPQMVQN